MTNPAETVREFFECMQARNWDGAADLLSPTVHVEFTETGEHFDGPDFLAMNRAYPEGWSIEVVETVYSETDDALEWEGSSRVAAQVKVVHGDDTFWCAGFYTVGAGRILDGVEHWVTQGSESPPEWRKPFSTRPTRRATPGGSPARRSRR